MTSGGTRTALTATFASAADARVADTAFVPDAMAFALIALKMAKKSAVDGVTYTSVAGRPL